jgi:hypothetical protein
VVASIQAKVIQNKSRCAGCGIQITAMMSA